MKLPYGRPVYPGHDQVAIMMMTLLQKALKIVLTSILISAVIYLCIATFLIIIGKPDKTDPSKSALAFDELFIDYSRLPELKKYAARDGEQLSFRHYPSNSNKILILL